MYTQTTAYCILGMEWVFNGYCPKKLELQFLLQTLEEAIIFWLWFWFYSKGIDVASNLGLVWILILMVRLRHEVPHCLQHSAVFFDNFDGSTHFPSFGNSFANKIEVLPEGSKRCLNFEYWIKVHQIATGKPPSVIIKNHCIRRISGHYIFKQQPTFLRLYS